MKVIGIHTFAGGFVLGVQRVRGLQFIGSHEMYKAAMPLAKAIGVKQIPGPRQADICIANPPCSRFSAMSASAYSKEQRTNLDTFDELKEVMQFAKESKVHTLWWETGPLAATSGLELIEQAAHQFEWDTHKKVTTFIIRLDTLWTGLPQRRKRTHIIHTTQFAGDPPRIPAENWPIGETVMEFCKRVVGDARNDPCVCWAPKHGGFITNPVKWTRGIRKANVGFKSSYPVLFDEHTTFSPSVVGAKQFAWVPTNKWWGLADYAAMMGYPVDADWYEIFEHKKKWPYVIGLMAQSVSPYASEWVARNVLLPALGKRKEHGSIPFESQPFDNCYLYNAMNNKLKLNIPYRHG